MVVIQLKTLQKEVFQIDIEDDSTILDLKEKIYDRFGDEKYRPKAQILTYANEPLENDETISSIRIQPLNHLLLICQDYSDEGPDQKKPKLDQLSDDEVDVIVSTPIDRDIAKFNKLYRKYSLMGPSPSNGQLSIDNFLIWTYKCNVSDFSLFTKKFLIKNFHKVSGNLKSISLEQLKRVIENLAYEAGMKDKVLYLLLEADVMPDDDEMAQDKLFDNYRT